LACHQPARYQDALFFVAGDDLEDAKKVFAGVGLENSKFYVHLIPVNGKEKWRELLKKSSAGCAEKDGNWVSDAREVSLDDLYDGSYVLLDRKRIERARRVKSQGLDRKNGHWCCGPNTGLRTAALLDESGHEYDEFIENCPKTLTNEKVDGIGNDLIIAGAVGYGAGMILSVALVPLTFGFSLFLPMAIQATSGAVIAGGFEAKKASRTTQCDVGPSPYALASYLNSKFPQHKAEFAGFSVQGEYERSINSDINNNFPRIVLLISGTFSMHYVNIIGIKPSRSGYFREAVILDTDGRIYVISDERLSYWTNGLGYAHFILFNNYNMIKFDRK
jgi:hypothetical protein